MSNQHDETESGIVASSSSMTAVNEPVAGGTASVAIDGSASTVVPPAHTGRLLSNLNMSESKNATATDLHATTTNETDYHDCTAAPSIAAMSREDLTLSRRMMKNKDVSTSGASVFFHDDEKTTNDGAGGGQYNKHSSITRETSMATLRGDGPEPAEAGKPQLDTQGPEVLTFRRFLPIFIGLLFTVFLVSLDNTVVATAQVEIARELDGQRSIAWLPTTFLIGQASFSIFYGQILAFFSTKSTFLSAMFLFELGSLVSALAPTMGAMLAGRTVSGVGAAGIFMSVMQILAETTTVAARAQYMGILGALFAISMVAGPLIGGALTDHVTWRWVFYINLPIGGLAFALILFLFPKRLPLGTLKSQVPSLRYKLWHIDIVGLTLYTGLVCMLVIPIQEAHQNGWNTAITWAPIACSVLVIALSQTWFKYLGEERALMPLRLFGDINFNGCAILSFLTFWNAISFTYLIPLFYQCVRGRTPTNSGVDMLALMITLALVSLITGVIAKQSGHYYPQLVLGPLFGVAGSALLYFQQVDSSLGFQIFTQILIGLGTGAVIQMPVLTVQANITDRRLLATATSFIVFSQRLGGGIGSSVSGAIVSAQLPVQIRKLLPPTSDPSRYVGLTPEMTFGLPLGPDRDAILRAVTKTITFVYIGGVPVFALIWLVILFAVRIKNIKTQKVTSKVDVFRSVFFLSRRKERGDEETAA